MSVHNATSKLALKIPVHFVFSFAFASHRLGQHLYASPVISPLSSVHAPVKILWAFVNRAKSVWCGFWKRGLWNGRCRKYIFAKISMRILCTTDAALKFRLICNAQVITSSPVHSFSKKLAKVIYLNTAVNGNFLFSRQSATRTAWNYNER